MNGPPPPPPRPGLVNAAKEWDRQLLFNQSIPDNDKEDIDVVNLCCELMVPTGPYRKDYMFPPAFLVKVAKTHL
jgi:hypothetical protein